MKLLSILAENQALVSICRSPSAISSKILASISAESFHYPPARAAYNQLVKILRAEGEIPSWHTLCSSPELPETIRKILKAVSVDALENVGKVASLVSTLEKYRKLRILLNAGRLILDSLEQESVKLDTLLDNATELLGRARSGNVKRTLFHLGKGNNSTQLLKRVLNAEKPPFIPTGFMAHDERNGGFLRGSLVLIGADSGGGKSSLAINLLRNMAEAAEDTVLVSLEMSEELCLSRLMALLTGLGVPEISQGKLTPKQQKLTVQAYKKWVLDLKKNNTRYSIYTPTDDVSLEDVLYSLKPYGYNVILIDYVSLLRDAVDAQDQQWLALQKLSRIAKRYAEANGILIVLLVQVSAEGSVKYSKSMTENANNAWIWVAPKEESDVMLLDIQQLKARNQHRFSFQLQSHNSSGLITDIDHAIETIVDETEEGFIKDLNEADEDE